MSSKRFVLVAVAILQLGSCAVAHGQLTVFFDNFDGGQVIASPVSGGWSGYTNTDPVQGFSGLGSTGNIALGRFLHNPTGDKFTNTPVEKSTLTLSGLPPHTDVQLKFLLAIIDTWDGGFVDPDSTGDIFNVDVDGIKRFAETFTNFDFGSQSYSAPAGALIARGPNLAVESFGDALYDMGVDTAHFGAIPHTGSTLRIDFFASGQDWNRPANESWAIDNVRVILVGVVPEPGPDSHRQLGYSMHWDFRPLSS